MDFERCNTTVIPFVCDQFPTVFKRFFGDVFTVANDDGASLRSYDCADAAGQTPGMALIVSLVLVKHKRQDGLYLDLRANQLPSLRVRCEYYAMLR